MGRELKPEDVYAAALDDEAASALPALLAQATNGRSASLHWQGPDGYVSLGYSEMSPVQMELFLAEFIHIDPWTQAALKPQWRGRIMGCETAVPPGEYEGSVYYTSSSARSVTTPSGASAGYCPPEAARPTSLACTGARPRAPSTPATSHDYRRSRPTWSVSCGCGAGSKPPAIGLRTS